jgi:hypothetical protein
METIDEGEGTFHQVDISSSPKMGNLPYFFKVEFFKKF